MAVNIINIIRPVIEVTGSIVVAYFVLRVVATVIDVLNRWRTGNWEV